MIVRIRRTPGLLALILALTWAAAAWSQDDVDKPKKGYDVGVCFDWRGGVSPARQQTLSADLMRLLDQEDAVERATELTYRLDTYGPWPGPGLDKDFICYTRVTFAGRANEFTILMRFYYVRGDYNIILPDIEQTGYGVYKLRSLFLRMFHSNFPVEAVVLRMRGDKVALSRGSDASVRQGDQFTILSKTTEWWDVFSQPAFEVAAVEESTSVMTIPAQAGVGERDAYLARIRALQPGQLVIRRNNDPGVYRTENNTFRIVWTDDRTPAFGARIMYSLGREDSVRNWRQGPQLLRQSVALSLPAGVPVSVKAMLQRGEHVIEGKTQFIERWRESPDVIALGLEPQYQDVNLAVVPNDILPVVKVDGRSRKDRPLKLRWGAHRIEVTASADERWFPWQDTVTIPAPGGKLTVQLQQDYRDQVLDKIRLYYNREARAATVTAEDFFAEETVDRSVLLIEAVSLMEQCPPDHPQFLNLRYTMAAVLTREGLYPEALLAMLNYNAGTGIGGVSGQDLRIVERGNWASNNVRLPRMWAWEWFIENPMSPLDRIDLDRALKLPPRALGAKLSAEDNEKIYQYLLGVLFYHYAHGQEKGQPYLSQTLDRCLAYLLAYHYLDQTNYPTQPDEPFLNASLTFYSKYYLLKLLAELNPLITDLNQRAQEVRREYEQLRKSMPEDAGKTLSERLKRQYGRLLLQMNLIDFHAKLTRRQKALKDEFLRFYDRFSESQAFKAIDPEAQRALAEKRAEVSRIDTFLGEIPERLQ